MALYSHRHTQEDEAGAMVEGTFDRTGRLDVALNIASSTLFVNSRR